MLNIPTKINKGTVEIITPVELIKKGDKVAVVVLMEKFRCLREFSVGASVALLIISLCGSQPVEALYGPSSDVLLITPSNFKSKVCILSIFLLDILSVRGS